MSSSEHTENRTTFSNRNQREDHAAPPLPTATASLVFVAPQVTTPPPPASAQAASASEESAEPSSSSQRRRRGRRGRRSSENSSPKSEERSEKTENTEKSAAEDSSDAENSGKTEEKQKKGAGVTRVRRRRRRRVSSDAQSASSDTSEESTSDSHDQVTAIKGSARLEAKRQRRRGNRENRKQRKNSILSEAEFLARRESVNRVMAVRQNGELTQIAVTEDDVLVEHYITRSSDTSYVGNVYLGKVQNVLPSMEAAFIDIGKGRNAVLYAGEVNWDRAGMEGKPRKIEQALKSGDPVLVQVTKDPIGHKGARLTSQISLPGRFLVYVPGGDMTGISRKLPDTERKRLKAILRDVLPEDAGVIVRTAAEGCSEEELKRDVSRLQAQWEAIEKKVSSDTSTAPELLYEEPDLVIRVIRDIFNGDVKKLIVQGDDGPHDAWTMVQSYVDHVAPELADRVSRHTDKEVDVFAQLRIDEQITKALDRKVWLPSGGSLVIDRTEAMTVVDVNTGRFTGKGGSLEETVTRNNLEAAEEIARQLRLRDVGGIIVIDFIDMVLESNRDLVLRRLTECLGRDRTRHQVSEVTSLGLVQMTRKRVGQGLLEAFSEPCTHCKAGRVITTSPVKD